MESKHSFMMRFQKQVILLYGPSGCGKTRHVYAKSVHGDFHTARLADIPVAFGNQDIKRIFVEVNVKPLNQAYFTQVLNWESTGGEPVTILPRSTEWKNFWN